MWSVALREPAVWRTTGVLFASPAAGVGVAGVPGGTSLSQQAGARLDVPRSAWLSDCVERTSALPSTDGEFNETSCPPSARTRGVSLSFVALGISTGHARALMIRGALASRALSGLRTRRDAFFTRAGLVERVPAAAASAPERGAGGRT